jgi:hypothetical protein
MIRIEKHHNHPDHPFILPLLIRTGFLTGVGLDTEDADKITPLFRKRKRGVILFIPSAQSECRQIHQNSDLHHY